jgi:ribosomal protein S6--L-glutamate ligase
VLNVTLISHSETYYSTRRLLEAGRALGFEMARVDPVRVILEAASRTATCPAIYEDGVEVPVPDVVIPRVGTTLETWSLALLQAWMVRGARSALTPAAIARASDKLLTTLRLVEAKLPVIPTVATREAYHAASTLARLPGEDWVMKSRTGSGGGGVALVHGMKSARSVLGALTAEHATVLVQPYIATEPTRDLRVLVAGGEPLAAYWREASTGEFRANIHLGGLARSADLPAAPIELALAAARATELPFSGIDLIETRDGFAILEVNASPGFQGIEEATQRDLATPFLERWIRAN